MGLSLTLRPKSEGGIYLALFSFGKEIVVKHV